MDLQQRHTHMAVDDDGDGDEDEDGGDNEDEDGGGNEDEDGGGNGDEDNENANNTATLTFESENYDAMTTQTVNQLISAAHSHVIVQEPNTPELPTPIPRARRRRQ
jgi:hypothetical protein